MHVGCWLTGSARSDLGAQRSMAGTAGAHLLYDCRRSKMKPSTQQLILICLLSAAMAPQTALGDAMMVSKAMTASTIAEFYIDRQGIRVEIEVGARDLVCVSQRAARRSLREARPRAMSCRGPNPDVLRAGLGDPLPMIRPHWSVGSSDWSHGSAFAATRSRESRYPCSLKTRRASSSSN